MKPTWIAAAIVGASAIAGSTKSATPLIIWNASPSVSIGFYVVRPAKPQRGQLAVVRLDFADRAQAVADRYLHGTRFLLKPVAAIENDRVCRLGAFVLIGGRVVARARARDHAGRPMPRWSGCRVLAANEIFLLATNRASFDGRYLGVTQAEQVIGTAVR